MQPITPIHSDTNGLNLEPVVLTAKNGKKYWLIDTRTDCYAAMWQMVHNWRVIEGAFRDQFNPKRKSGAWRVQEVA